VELILLIGSTVDLQCPGRVSHTPEVVTSLDSKQTLLCSGGTVSRTDAFEVAGKKPHQRNVSLPRHLKTLAKIGVLYGNDRQGSFGALSME
jgi:hypothetical protein